MNDKPGKPGQKHLPPIERMTKFQRLSSNSTERDFDSGKLDRRSLNRQWPSNKTNMPPPAGQGLHTSNNDDEDFQEWIVNLPASLAVKFEDSGEERKKCEESTMESDEMGQMCQELIAECKDLMKMGPKCENLNTEFNDSGEKSERSKVALSAELEAELSTIEFDEWLME